MLDHDRITGEESIIQEFLAPLAAGWSGAFGLRDDCALLVPEPGAELVLKTDPIIAGVHFLPGEAPEHVAWKALAVNVSDLAAKGAKPLAYLMALALPDNPQRAWMERFAAGLADAQRRFGCHLIGGDTDRTPGPLTVSITVIGSVPAGQMVRRGTAKAGNRLFISGEIGSGAIGLALRRQPELAARWGLGESDVRPVVEHFLRPIPRLELGPLLREHASAAMDISDGLVKDCRRMCLASGVGARIEAARLPRLTATMKAIAIESDRWSDVLAGGDDYEILAAVSPDRAASFGAAAAAAEVPVTEIGEVVAGRGVVVLDERRLPLPLERTGYDHF
jgi:thiamine-monophosphate kinase